MTCISSLRPDRQAGPDSYWTGEGASPMSNQRMTGIAGAIAALALVPCYGASAQALTDLSVDQLRGVVRTRYDAALATSTAPTVVSADNKVHTWASEAKVQCGIALGFLKSGSKDDHSLRRCDFAKIGRAHV